MRLQPYEPRKTPHIEAVTRVWNTACGADLAISSRLVAFNSRPATGSVQAGWLATAEDAVVGFVLASALPNDPAASPPETGWIDAMAVAPSHQRRGRGSALLAQAERWLVEQCCAAARLGGSLHPFAPGLPVELHSEPFFQARGYRPRPDEATVWDVASDLAGIRQRALPVVRPPFRLAIARAADGEALLAFLRREFPGRWRFEFEEFLRAGGRMSEYCVLWRKTAGRAHFVDGFCRIRRRWRYSVDPLDRFFMHRLPTPWGQLGPVGVGLASRGQGLGSALIEFSLGRLAAVGVRGCVIDWTTQVDFYARFGFSPLRSYRVLVKDLQGTTL